MNNFIGELESIQNKQVEVVELKKIQYLQLRAQ